MANRRQQLIRFILVVIAVTVLVLVGVGQTISVLVTGTVNEVPPPPRPSSHGALTSLNRGRAEPSGSPAPQPAEPLSSPRVESPDDAATAEEHQQGSRAASNGTSTPVPVWNFVHRKSRGDAVRTVRNLTIEPINPYLKKKSGGRWIGIHPSDLRLTLLLPRVADELKPSARLVYIDLGARMYPGSTGWFLKHYPRSREFHAVLFELLDLEHTYIAARPYFRSFTYERKAAWTHSRGVQIKGMRMARVDDNVVVQRGDNRQTWLSPSVDVAAYLKSNYTKDDFVALKLDIEGGEWTLIPHLISTGAMDLVDELFLECHPINFDDYLTEPNRLPSICVDFINDLRALGIYCHRWF